MFNYMRKQVELVCNNPDCGKKYFKAISEYKRNQDNGRPSYCSRQCAGHVNLIINVGDKRFDISKFAGKNCIKKEPFKRYIRIAKARDKFVNVDVAYLENVWNNQNGKCVYTGVSLMHPKESGENDYIITASLDRINSNFGYIQGNVQFISVCMNMMKNKLNHAQTIEICRQIAKYWNY